MADTLDGLRTALADRYRIERELGAGGMATVYLAQDLRHDRPVAFKMLRPELSAAIGGARFLNEIGLTAKLQHPHILTLIDSGETGGVLWYVMPYVEGESLRGRIQREGRLPLGVAVQIVRDVGAALDHAHRHGIIHRDIKPENILLGDGGAIVADFGIAVAISSAASDRLTATGLAIGSPTYMSPEQMSGDRTLDIRTDLYALAGVVFEMLTGEAPYSAPTFQAMVARRVTEPVPSLHRARPELPAALDRVMQKAMAPRPEDRYQSVTAFVDALVAATTVVPRRRLLAPVAMAVAVMALGVSWPLWTRLQRERARTSLAEIQRLADQGHFVEAYGLALSAEGRIGGDTTLRRLFPQVSDRFTITSKPAGATVTLQRFGPGPDGVSPRAVSVGATPIRNLRVARGDYRVVIAKTGFAPLERIASSAYQRAELMFNPDSAVEVHLALTPTGAGAPDMVPVPGGRYELVSEDAPPGASADLDDFEIDRHEVTNADYLAFIRSGGYASPDLWSPLQQGDLRRLVDRTGLPGPRSWTNQLLPEGRERHPVTDISWYEARAYCRSVRKDLPTLFQWEKAARNGLTATGTEIVLPWGPVAPREPATWRANFASQDTRPVESYPFGISPFGAYDMAGNVREWTRTPSGERYAATGGAFEDPPYLFPDLAFTEPLTSGRALGFRCARTRAGATGDQGAAPLDISRRTPSYRPVDAATFRNLLSHYQYDRHPLDPRVTDRQETDNWTRERIRFSGVKGDSVLGYLFLPKQAKPPYQTIVYVPSSASFFAVAPPDEAVWLLDAHIKSGRAVFAPVLKGMVGRDWGAGHVKGLPSSVGFRDDMVLQATELRLALDYLATRPDIDMTRLAYLGLSLGAGSRLVFAGVDDRYRAVIFVGGGIDERSQPTLPEASNINFAAYIKAPKLMVNGRNDEEHVWLTRGLPLWNLLREPKKLVLVDGAGHVPPAEARVPAINTWLDEVFGPVKR